MTMVAMGLLCVGGLWGGDVLTYGCGQRLFAHWLHVPGVGADAYLDCSVVAGTNRVGGVGVAVNDRCAQITHTPLNVAVFEVSARGFSGVGEVADGYFLTHHFDKRMGLNGVEYF